MDRRILEAALFYRIDTGELEGRFFTTAAERENRRNADEERRADSPARCRWRENSQAKAWAGLAVADVLKRDAKDKFNRAKITSLLKTWITLKCPSDPPHRAGRRHD